MAIEPLDDIGTRYLDKETGIVFALHSSYRGCLTYYVWRPGQLGKPQVGFMYSDKPWREEYFKPSWGTGWPERKEEFAQREFTDKVGILYWTQGYGPDQIVPQDILDAWNRLLDYWRARFPETHGDWPRAVAGYYDTVAAKRWVRIERPAEVQP